MKILNRYVGLQVVGAILLVLFILLGVETFTTFVTQMGDIGKGDYGVVQALFYVPMLLPWYMYDFFPVAALIGGLIALGRLASQSELIVMRAAGVSKLQILWTVVKATLILLIIVTAIGETIAPSLKAYATDYKTAAKNAGVSATNRQGVWIRDGNSFIHIDTVLPGGHVEGVTRYQFNGHVLTQSTYAKSGVFQNGKWQFENVKTTSFTPEKTTSYFAKHEVIDVNINPNLLGVAEVKTDQASVVDLYNYIHYLKASGLLSTEYEYEFWKRLLKPFITIVMIALAVPIIFGPLRTVTMGLRVMIGVIIGFCFYTINEFFGPFSMVYQIPPIWAAAIPLLIFALADVFLMWRTR